MSGCGPLGGGGDLRAGARAGVDALLALSVRLEAQDAQLAALAERVEGLEQRLNYDSSRPNLPPATPLVLRLPP